MEDLTQQTPNVASVEAPVSAPAQSPDWFEQQKTAGVPTAPAAPNEPDPTAAPVEPATPTATAPQSTPAAKEEYTLPWKNTEEMDKYIYSASQRQAAFPGQEPNKEDPSVFSDIMAAPFRGVLNAGHNAYRLVDYMTSGLLSKDDDPTKPDWDLGHSKTLVGGLIENTSQFLTLFLPAAAAAAVAGPAIGAGALGTAALETVGAGMAADFVAFDGKQGRLSDWAESIAKDHPALAPILVNPVTEALKSDEDEGVIESRFKGAIEGALSGLAIGGAVQGAKIAFGMWKGVKAARAGRLATEAGATPEEAAAAVNKVAASEDIQKSITELQDDAHTDKTAAPETPVTPDANAKPNVKQVIMEGEKVQRQGPDSLTSRPAPEPIKVSDDAVQQILDTYGSGKTTAELKGAVEPEALNIKTINSSEDAARLISSTAIALEQGYAASKNVLPDAVRHQHAAMMLDEIGIEPRKFLAETEGVRDGLRSAPSLVTAMKAVRDSSYQGMINDAKTVVAAGKGDLSLWGSLQESMQRSVLVDQAIKDMGTSGGQLLRAMRGEDPLHIKYTSYLKSHSEINPDLKNPDIVKYLLQEDPKTQEELLKKAEALVAAAGPDGKSLVKVSKMMQDGRFINSLNEWYINSLLWSPRTIVTNVTGTAGTTLVTPLQQASGAILQSLIERDPSLLMVARGAMKQYKYMMSSMDESWRLAKLSFSSKRSLLSPRNSVVDEIPRNYVTAQTWNVQNPFLASLVNGLGKYVRYAGDFMRSGDEFIKNINVRSAAKTRLYSEGLEQVSQGKLPMSELENYVENGFQGIINKNGALYTKSSVVKQAIDDGKAKGLAGLDLDSHVKDYLDQNWDPNKSALADYAFQQANENTFTGEFDRNAKGGFEGMSREVESFVNKMPILRFLAVPFIRTPLRILSYVGRREPLSNAAARLGIEFDIPLIKNLQKMNMAELMSEDPFIQAQAAGRITMGATLVSTAAALAWNGSVTGYGPQDANQRKLLMQTGWKPYSLKLGDNYYSYAKLDPFATFFGVMGDIADRLKSQDHMNEDKLHAMSSAAIIAMTRNVTDKTYMAGLDQLFQLIDNPEVKGDSWFKMKAGSLIPSGLGLLNKTIADPYMRESRSVMDAITQGLPGGSSFLESKRNVLGERVLSPNGAPDFASPISGLGPQGAGAGALAGAAGGAALGGVPGALAGAVAGGLAGGIAQGAKVRKDPVMDEMAQLKFGFSNPSNKIDGNIDMTDYHKDGQTAYDRFMELSGQLKLHGHTLRETLGAQIDGKDYQKLLSVPQPDIANPRVALIRNTIQKFRDAAMKETMREFPDFGRAYRKAYAAKEAAKVGGDLKDFLSTEDN